jgi:hypothetical protein
VEAFTLLKCDKIGQVPQKMQQDMFEKTISAYAVSQL